MAWKKVRLVQQKLYLLHQNVLFLPSFLNAIAKINLSMVVIDEAHCVVSWGHHFRPEYAEIGKNINKINPPRILALTATAGRSGSRQDIIKKVFPKLISKF